ncbi:MAG: response regulator [Pseudomonadota bacterium]
MDGTVLVADDDRTIRTVLTQALTRAGCKVHATSSIVTLMRWVDEGKGDLVISDVMMPDGNGLETLPKIVAKRPGLPVIIISAQNNIMTAIQATEAEAYDYLPKPFDLPDLMKKSARALDAKRRVQQMDRGTDTEQSDDLPLVGRTPAMQDLYRLLARTMNTELAILVQGESGTGKSLIARAIHDLSDRRTLPFVVVTATDADTNDGFASALARAKGGTLLLDEIADFSSDAQTRIVRQLDGMGDMVPRIAATSQVDLAIQMEQGKFRSDLYYRLAGVVVDVPVLRDRVDDIPLLADHFLTRTERDGGPVRRLAHDALAASRAYSWPGNVRQLENVVRRLSFTASEADISVLDVAQILGAQPAIEQVSSHGESDKLSASVARHIKRYFDLHGGTLPPPGVYQRILREVETPLIEISLDATAGNQAKCADLLGINRNTLRKKITELDIVVTRRRKLM